MGWNEIPFAQQRPYYARDLDGLEWSPRALGIGELVKREGGKCGTIVARAQLRGPRDRIPAARRDSAIRKDAIPAEHRAKVPTEFMWFHALRVDDQNQLWVEREVAGGSRFDVFSPTGQPVAEVDIPRGLILETPQFALIAMANNRVVGFVKNKDDLVYLVSWRITR